MGKLSTNMVYFSVIYFFILTVLAIAGNLNLSEVEQFNGFYNSMITVLDISLGNIDTEIFQNMKSPGTELFS
jgi:hypothetical protein